MFNQNLDNQYLVIDNNTLEARAIDTITLVDFFINKLSINDLIDFLALLVNLSVDETVYFINSSFDLTLSTIETTNLCVA